MYHLPSKKNDGIFQIIDQVNKGYLSLQGVVFIKFMNLKQCRLLVSLTRKKIYLLYCELIKLCQVGLILQPQTFVFRDGHRFCEQTKFTMTDDDVVQKIMNERYN